MNVSGDFHRRRANCVWHGHRGSWDKHYHNCRVCPFNEDYDEPEPVRSRRERFEEWIGWLWAWICACYHDHGLYLWPVILGLVLMLAVEVFAIGMLHV